MYINKYLKKKIKNKSVFIYRKKILIKIKNF